MCARCVHAFARLCFKAKCLLSPPHLNSSRCSSDQCARWRHFIVPFGRVEKIAVFTRTPYLPINRVNTRPHTTLENAMHRNVTRLIPAALAAVGAVVEPRSHCIRSVQVHTLASAMRPTVVLLGHSVRISCVMQAIASDKLPIDSIVLLKCYKMLAFVRWLVCRRARRAKMQSVWHTQIASY